jgi:hypothetical protein
MLTLLKNIYSGLVHTGMEVLTDAPYRIEPGMAVPLVCLVKENKNKPFTIESIKVKIIQKGKTLQVASALRTSVDVKTSKWHKVIRIPMNNSMLGEFALETVVKINRNGKTRVVKSRSVQGENDGILRIFRASDTLPKFKGFYFGDIHYHCLSASKAESVGAQLLFASQAAQALGLQFFAATDHSHDLEDGEGPESVEGTGKWDMFRAKVDSLNSENEDVIILPGEEVKCKNHRGRDVDLIIINYPEFIRGSHGGSVQEKRHDSNLKELLGRVGSAAATFAVHPIKQTSIYEKLFLGKGRWSKFDLTLAGLTGMQIYDGKNEYFLDKGIKNWIELLLKGDRKFIVAGSNSYADFGEQIKPASIFKKTKMQSLQEFGKARTGLFCTKPITKEKIVSSIKEGKSVISTGPLLDFTVLNETGDLMLIGGEIAGSLFTIKFRAVSSPEFGSIKEIKLFLGEIFCGKEEQVFSIKLSKNRYYYNGNFQIERRGKINYIRGELLSCDSGLSRFCLTNPIWLRPTKD